LATSIHHVPGRLRLTVTRFKADPAALGAARRSVLAMTGVVEAAANPVTGSLVIRYDRQQLDPDALWQGLVRGGLVRGAAPFVAGAPVTRCEIPDGPGDGVAGQLLEMLARAVVEQLARRSVAALIAAFV
jgi:Heavy metal associated domain 2